MLSPEKKKKLKAEAHALNPVVMVAGKGLTDNVMNEVELALDCHELIKVKIAGYEKADKLALIDQIQATTKAEVVQVIGHVAVLYRVNPEKK